MKKLLQFFMSLWQLPDSFRRPKVSSSLHKDISPVKERPHKTALSCDLTIYATGIYTIPHLKFYAEAGIMYRFTFYVTYHAEWNKRGSVWGLEAPQYDYMELLTEHSSVNGDTVVIMKGTIKTKTAGMIFPSYLPVSAGERMIVKKRVSWVEYDAVK